MRPEFFYTSICDPSVPDPDDEEDEEINADEEAYWAAVDARIDQWKEERLETPDEALPNLLGRGRALRAAKPSSSEGEGGPA